MRLWLTRSSALSMREQLVRQIMLGILSADLPTGTKLPSIRALARRHRIHSNTVSLAYRELLAKGWLELRRGSGVYVRPIGPAPGVNELDGFLNHVLREAATRGWTKETVAEHLQKMIAPPRLERVLVIEPERELGEILVAELREKIGVPIELNDAGDETPVRSTSGYLVVALTARLRAMEARLAPGVSVLELRLRSVESSLSGQQRPDKDGLVTIVSRSAEIRFWSRAMLLAVGIQAESLCEVDAMAPDWRERVQGSGLVVTDVVTGRELAGHPTLRIFRVVADASMGEVLVALR